MASPAPSIFNVSSEVPLASLSGNDRGVVAPSGEVDWDGQDDPKNPMNWSEKRRLISVILISIFGFLTYVLLIRTTIEH